MLGVKAQTEHCETSGVGTSTSSEAFPFSLDIHVEVTTTQMSRQTQLGFAEAQECVRWKSLFCIVFDTVNLSSFFILHIVLFLTSAVRVSKFMPLCFETTDWKETWECFLVLE